MDEQKDRTEISSLGEFKLIDHLTKNFEINNISSVKGIGDDAAIIDNAGKLTVVTTDMLVEGVHFDMMYTPLLHLGYKCIAVNVSDIYAMNATPKQIVAAIGDANEGEIVYRSGAKEEDLICVSGDLGAAYLGLQMLEREKKIYLENPNIQPDLENKKHLIGKFLKPEARKDIIQFFKDNDITPTAMIDVSDGLSSEILHMCIKWRRGL